VSDAFAIAADLLDPPSPLTVDQRRWALDPVAWVREVLSAEPDEWQAEALDALAHGKNVAVRSGHGVGKTAFLAWVVLWFMDTHAGNIRVPCAAPTLHQLEDLLWPEMQVWLGRSLGLKHRIEWRASRIFVHGSERTAFAVQRAAGPENKPENLAGYHADHLLYVIDEASGVGDTNMAVATGALSTEGAQMVLAGNPTRANGYFANRFTRTLDRWYTATVSSLESSRASAEFAEAIEEEWGVESDEYRVRVLGLPPRGNPAGFIPPELVEEAQARLGIAEGALVVGVDVARYGRDKTAFAARRGAVILPLKTHRKLSNPQVAERVLEYIDELRQEPDERVRVIVDDGGVGGGVTDLLHVARREGANISVSGVNFGGAGDKHYNTNAGVWWHRLRLLLQKANLCLPPDNELRSQLTDRTATMNMKGKMVLETKEHMRERGVPSPDKADAVALTVADGGQGSAFLDYWKSRSRRTEKAPSSGLGLDEEEFSEIEEEEEQEVVRCDPSKKKCTYGPVPIGGGDRHCLRCGHPPP
jgi:hypothetical protein